MKPLIPRPAEESGFLFLFVSLMIMGALYPLITYGPVGRFIVGTGLTVVLFAAIRALASRRLHRRIGIALALPTFVVNWVLVAHPHEITDAVAFALSGAFYSFVTWRLFVEIYYQEGFRRDRVYGGGAVYILIGATFASIFGFLETLQPGSFSGLTSDLSIRPDLTYFSFVTLTTLGYGDIQPVASFARSLASIEAILGVLYVAIVIARFASAEQTDND